MYPSRVGHLASPTIKSRPRWAADVLKTGKCFTRGKGPRKVAGLTVFSGGTPAVDNLTLESTYLYSTIYFQNDHMSVDSITGRRPEKIMCPSCWEYFSLEDVLWFARFHKEIEPDPFLTEYDSIRFLPEHFTPSGKAICENGDECELLACPHCHLEIPRSYLNSFPIVTSVVGGVGVGKSYYHATLVQWIRDSLKKNFGWHGELATYVHQRDGKRPGNEKLTDQAEILFPLRRLTEEEENVPVTLEKTDQDDNCQEVKRPTGPNGEMRMEKLIIPFIYDLIPSNGLLNVNENSTSLYSVCLYDHAGENLRLGTDAVKLSQHLKTSNAIFFLYDPTYNGRFSKAMGYSGTTETNQWDIPSNVFRNMKNMITNDVVAMIDVPLVVIVTKCDLWMHLLTPESQKNLMSNPWGSKSGVCSLSQSTLRDVSVDIRNLMEKYDVSFVNDVEQFASDVLYVPVSATGNVKPEVGPDKVPRYKPHSLKPIWIGVPFLYVLARHRDRLIGMEP